MQWQLGTQKPSPEVGSVTCAWNYWQSFSQKPQHTSVCWNQQGMRKRTHFKGEAEDYLKLFGKSPGSSQSGKLRRPPIWCSNSWAEKRENLGASSLLKVSWNRAHHILLSGSCLYLSVLFAAEQGHTVWSLPGSRECLERLPLIAKVFIVWRAIIISARLSLSV